MAAYKTETARDCGTGRWPPELLAALACRLPPAEHLVSHERQPDPRDGQHDDSRQVVTSIVSGSCPTTGCLMQ
jgi:hypothetical protein